MSLCIDAVSEVLQTQDACEPSVLITTGEANEPK
jgi:hypothetical protein